MRPRPRALIAAALTAVLISGCAAGTPESQSAEGEITVALGASPVNLDYTSSSGAAIPQALLYNVYESLFKLDANGELQPLLAEDYAISEDRLTYTLYLRQGVTFSDGAPMDARAVKYSLDRLDEWTTAPGGLLSVIESTAIVDDHTVNVHLSAPDNMLLDNLAGPGGTVFKPGTEDELASTAIGTGPYMVESYTPGTTLRMVANDNYWGGEPPAERLTLDYYADMTAQTNALLSGGADVGLALQSPELLSQFEDDPAFVVHEGTTNGEMVMPINMRREPFDDLRVRQALRHAVDGDAVREVAAEGYGAPLNSLVPPTDPWYDDRPDPYPYDPDRARELLAEADAEDLVIDFKVPSSPVYQTTAQVVASQLRDVGLDVRTETLEFPAVWLAQVFSGHDFDITVINVVEPKDVVQFSNPDFVYGYQNPEADEILNRARTGEPDDYVPLMREYANLVSDDAAAHFLYLTPWLTVSRADIEGVMPNLAGESYDMTQMRRTTDQNTGQDGS